jgi:lipoic acid synthetase
MLGLGETDEEVRQAIADLRAIGVDILTLDQYLQVSPVPAFDFGAACVSIVSSYKPNYLMLQPTDKHLTVREYVPPEKFQFWKEYGESIGFRYVASGPLVSYTYNRLSILIISDTRIPLLLFIYKKEVITLPMLTSH